MNLELEKCGPFLSSQTWQLPAASPASESSSTRLAITISRQSGSGGQRIAQCLLGLLQAATPGGPSWVLYDANLVQQVLQDHGLSPRLARFMPEDRVADLADLLDELLGTHPPSRTLVEQTADTIRRLASRGHVIIVDRGAHVVTSKLAHVFRVRLVGSLEHRIQHFSETRGVNRSEALKFIRIEDRGRRRYLKKYFGQEPDDPNAYNLILNTDSLSHEQAARLIHDAATQLIRNQQRPCLAQATPAADPFAFSPPAIAV